MMYVLYGPMMYVVEETMRARLASCSRNLLLPMGHGPYTRDRKPQTYIIGPLTYYMRPALPAFF